MLKHVQKAMLVFALASVLFIVAGCAGQTPAATPTATAAPTAETTGIYGRWEGVDNKNDVVFAFTPDGKVTLLYLGSLHGGTFTLDEKTTPMQLDLNWDDIGPVKTILEFVDNDTIRFENNYPGVDRPTKFADFITLKRAK